MEVPQEPSQKEESEEDDFDYTVAETEDEKAQPAQEQNENMFDTSFKGLDIDLGASEERKCQGPTQDSPEQNNASMNSAAQQSFSAMFASKE